jgi:formylglycine-generating enzyme required for sulfatase activity
MSETEVTQELFAAVMGGERPGYFTTNPEDTTNTGWKKLPVECVSWYAAIAFCNKLSLADGKEPVYSIKISGVEVDWENLAYSEIPADALNSNIAAWDAVTMDASKNGYRLPTEMEWMWAAMGATLGGTDVSTTGQDKTFAGDNGNNNIDDYAWHGTNSSSTTHEVGKKNANELGLRDMSGNVWEWCWDWYDNYPTGEKQDYEGPDSGSGRALRGGSYYNPKSDSAVAARTSNTMGSYYTINTAGFRVVCGD